MVAVTRRPALSVTLQQLCRANVLAAATLLTHTSPERTRADLAADLSRNLDVWPMLQLGAFGVQGELLGVATGVMDTWELRVGWLLDLVVAERVRGLGVGSLLLDGQLGSLAALGVERVRGGLAPALLSSLPFLERRGFRAIQHLTAFSGRGLDATEEVLITEATL